MTTLSALLSALLSAIRSCPEWHSLLDGDHLLNAVRYVELNPVRAGLVQRAEDWPWSSAAVHAGLAPGTDPLPFPVEAADWSAWLGKGLNDVFCEKLRRNTATGRPTGCDTFIRRIETQLTRELSPARKRGRPRKVIDNTDLTPDLFS